MTASFHISSYSSFIITNSVTDSEFMSSSSSVSRRQECPKADTLPKLSRSDKLNEMCLLKWEDKLTLIVPGRLLSCQQFPPPDVFSETTEQNWICNWIQDINFRIVVQPDFHNISCCCPTKGKHIHFINLKERQLLTSPNIADTFTVFKISLRLH